MDVNDFRAWMTVVVFAAFIGIAAWAYSRPSKERMEKHAQIPFNDAEDKEEQR